MTSLRRIDRITPVLLGGALIAAAALTGCEEKPPPVAAKPVTPRNTTPPPPPPPAVTPVSTLMAKLSIDSRVVLPEEKAPSTTADREAVLVFFDSFVRGDVTNLKSRMDMLDGMELEALAQTDAWDDTIQGINEVALETGISPFDDKCVLALYDVDGEYQPQLWYYRADGGSYTFESAPTPPDIMDKLYGADWIARWHELLAEELELANALDPELDDLSVDLDEGSDPDNPSAGGGPGPGGGPRPASPGRGPDRRPIPPKRKPPGSK